MRRRLIGRRARYQEVQRLRLLLVRVVAQIHHAYGLLLLLRRGLHVIVGHLRLLRNRLTCRPGRSIVAAEVEGSQEAESAAAEADHAQDDDQGDEPGCHDVIAEAVVVVVGVVDELVAVAPTRPG